MLGSIRPRGNAASHHGTVLYVCLHVCTWTRSSQHSFSPSSLPGPVGQHSLTRASKPPPRCMLALLLQSSPRPCPCLCPSVPSTLNAMPAHLDKLTSIAPGPKSHHPSPFVFRPPRVILLRSPCMLIPDASARPIPPLFSLFPFFPQSRPAPRPEMATFSPCPDPDVVPACRYTRLSPPRSLGVLVQPTQRNNPRARGQLTTTEPAMINHQFAALYAVRTRGPWRKGHRQIRSCRHVAKNPSVPR